MQRPASAEIRRKKRGGYAAAKSAKPKKGKDMGKKRGAKTTKKK